MESYGYTFRSLDFRDLQRVLDYLLMHPENVNAMKTEALSHVRKNYSSAQRYI